MAQIVHLDAGESMPDVGDDAPWLVIEASEDRLFFGSGASWKPSGEWVGYLSLSEDDNDIESALNAAQEWAAKYDVPTIWVQLTRDSTPRTPRDS